MIGVKFSPTNNITVVFRDRIYTGGAVDSVNGKTGTVVLTASDVGALPVTVAASGLVVDFTAPKIFNTVALPGTANVSQNVTGAKLGIVQKVYHSALSEPSFPNTWVKIGSGEYVTGELNIIYAEWCGNGRVEYWIVQES